MANIPPPEPKAQALLGVIAQAIAERRMRLSAPETLLTYAEAVEFLGGRSKPGHAGAELQKMGLRQLRRWTKSHEELPKVDGLIVEKKTRRPASGFLKAHGHENDPEWEEWWSSEAECAIEYDWSQFLRSVQPYKSKPAAEDTPVVREEGETASANYRDLIVADPPPARVRTSHVTVAEILEWMAQGQTEQEILQRHQELNSRDVRASLAWAAAREKRTDPAGYTPLSKLGKLARSWGAEVELPKSDPDDPRMDFLLERYWRNRE